jgi:hypothetical protein
MLIHHSVVYLTLLDGVKNMVIRQRCLRAFMGEERCAHTARANARYFKKASPSDVFVHAWCSCRYANISRVMEGTSENKEHVSQFFYDTCYW